jgi:hypothetical protein
MGSMWLGIHVNLLMASVLYVLLAVPMRALRDWTVESTK